MYIIHSGKPGPLMLAAQPIETAGGEREAHRTENECLSQKQKDKPQQP